MLYQNGRYKVEVGGDGTIKVAPGDWLSKYSAAIHNDFTSVRTFARKNAAGAPEPITNVNFIRVGEVLYHLPTYYRSISPMVIHGRRPPAHPELSNVEKKKLIEESLKRDFNLRGDRLPLLSKAIDIIGYAENAITLAEIAGLIAETGVVASAGTVLSLAGCFLFPVGGAIALVNSWEFGERLTGMRAVAYGTTAWAFDDPAPPFPARLRGNILSSHGRETAFRHESAWSAARDQAMRNIGEDVGKRKVSKSNYQVLLRAIGNNQRRGLVDEVMRGFEASLREGMERRALWSPEPNYPN